MAAEPLLDPGADRVMLRRVNNGWIAACESYDIRNDHRKNVELVASTPAELASLVQQWAAAQLPEKREADAMRRAESELALALKTVARDC